MRTIKIILSLVTVSVFAFSCKSQYDAILQSNDIDAKYRAAMNYFKQGKYDKSAYLFESIAVLASNTEHSDTIRYYWGLSNFKQKDYAAAQANFEKFISMYPNIPMVKDAKFKRIECLYNQTLRYELDPSPAYLTITAINEYMTDYPDTEHRKECNDIIMDLKHRLNLKSFEAARLYYYMEDYKAAIIAFKNILKEDPDNMYREDILYHIALSSYKYAELSVKEKQKERYLNFIEDYYNFMAENPDSKYAPKLTKLFSEVKNIIGDTVEVKKEENETGVN